MALRILFALILLCPVPGLAQSSDSEQALTPTERQFGLALAWSTVRENYVNFDTIPVNWDSLYQTVIPRVAEPQSDYEYYQVLRLMLAQIGDGHTRISLPGDMRRAWERNLPLRVRLVNGSVVVTNVLNDSLYDAGVRPGMSIASINGQDPYTYGVTHIMPTVSSSTEQDRMLRTFDYEFFRGPADEGVTLELVSINNTTLIVEASRRLPWDRWTRKPVLEFNVLDENVGHLKLNRFDSRDFYAAFDSVYTAILETDALVLDARDNGGGSSSYGYYLLSHLVDHTFSGTNWYSKHHVPKIKAGERRTDYYLHKRHTFEPVEGERYRKPVVLLVNEATFSATEDFAATFDHIDRGQIIGSPTGGSSGQPIVVNLPGGGRVLVCTERNTYPDGKEFVGVGVIPDIIVKPTVESLESGTDVVLARAVKELGIGS